MEYSWNVIVWENISGDAKTKDGIGLISVSYTHLSIPYCMLSFDNTIILLSRLLNLLDSKYLNLFMPTISSRSCEFSFYCKFCIRNFTVPYSKQLYLKFQIRHKCIAYRVVYGMLSIYYILASGRLGNTAYT